MRRVLRIGILTAAGVTCIALATVFAANAGWAGGAGAFLIGLAFTLLGFLHPVVSSLNGWVTFGALALAFWLHHRSSGAEKSTP